MVFLLAGIILSLVNAFKEILIKHNLKSLDSKILMGIVSLSSSILILPFVIREGFPALTTTFLLVFFFGGILYFVGKYNYFQALKYGEISFISPLKGLVVVNVVFTSWLLLGEIPSIIGAGGIALVLLGVYILSIQKGHIKILDPIKHLFTDRGSRLYLITAVAYGFTVTIDKLGALETSPFFRGLCMNLFLFLTVLPYIIKHRKRSHNLIKKNYKSLSGLVILHTLVYVGQMYVIKYILASYTSAFKTSSTLFVIILGGLLFKEKNLKKKFLSGLIIVVGILLIVFS